MKDRGEAEGIMEGGVGSESPIITSRQTQVARLSIENSRRWACFIASSLRRSNTGHHITRCGRGGTPHQKKKRERRKIHEGNVNFQ